MNSLLTIFEPKLESLISLFKLKKSLQLFVTLQPARKSCHFFFFFFFWCENLGKLSRYKRTWEHFLCSHDSFCAILIWNNISESTDITLVDSTTSVNPSTIFLGGSTTFPRLLQMAFKPFHNFRTSCIVGNICRYNWEINKRRHNGTLIANLALSSTFL